MWYWYRQPRKAAWSASLQWTASVFASGSNPGHFVTQNINVADFLPSLGVFISMINYTLRRRAWLSTAKRNLCFIVDTNTVLRVVHAPLLFYNFILALPLSWYMILAVPCLKYRRGYITWQIWTEFGNICVNYLTSVIQTLSWNSGCRYL